MKNHRSSQSVLSIIDMIEGFVNEGPLSYVTLDQLVLNIRRFTEKILIDLLNLDYHVRIVYYDAVINLMFKIGIQHLESETL